MTLPEGYAEDDQPSPEQNRDPISKRSRGVALGLGFFGGFFGLHRFYVGKIGSAIGMLCTFGGLGVWWLYDMVLLATGEFTDAGDKPLRRWGVEEGPSSGPGLRGQAAQRVELLEDEVDGLRKQFNDLAERVDFAERMLAKQREPNRPQLPRG